MKVELRGDVEFWANVIACAEAAIGDQAATLWGGQVGADDSPVQLVFWPLTEEPGFAVRVVPDEDLPGDGAWEAYGARSDARE